MILEVKQKRLSEFASSKFLMRISGICFGLFISFLNPWYLRCPVVRKNINSIQPQTLTKLYFLFSGELSKANERKSVWLNSFCCQFHQILTKLNKKLQLNNNQLRHSYLERLNLLRWVDQCGQDLANAGLNSAFDWDNFDICDQTSYAWS